MLVARCYSACTMIHVAPHLVFLSPYFTLCTCIHAYAQLQFNQQNFNAAVGAAGIPPPFLPQGGIPPPPQIMASYPAPIPLPSTVTAPSSSSTPSSTHPRHSASSSSKPADETDGVSLSTYLECTSLSCNLCR